MSAAEDLLRQALSLPEDERRDLVAKLAASLPEDDEDACDDLDPEDIADAVRELEAHRADPSQAIDAATIRARLAERWGVR